MLTLSLSCAYASILDLNLSLGHGGVGSGPTGDGILKADGTGLIRNVSGGYLLQTE